MRIVPASDSALLISFADAISLEAHRKVLSLFHAMQSLRDPRIRNLHPAYSSLLIDFDPLRLRHEELADVVRKLIDENSPATLDDRGCAEIPVCYDREFAPDLAEVAEHAGLTEEQVVAMHEQGEYFVYFIGFSPGFAYLGGLPTQLQVPRLATPRKHVRAGSVGIAGEQTGIYPNDSPGGWRLIGRTPLRMFDPCADPPSRLQAGDHVRFRRIARNEFDRLAEEQQKADDPRH